MHNCSKDSRELFSMLGTPHAPHVSVICAILLKIHFVPPSLSPVALFHKKSLSNMKKDPSKAGDDKLDNKRGPPGPPSLGATD